MDTIRNSGQTPTARTEPAAATGSYEEVVIGILLGFQDQGAPLVAFPGNPEKTALKARTTTKLREENLSQSLVIGVVQHPGRTTEARTPLTAELDGECIRLSAQKEIVLQCGKASITLTRAGKILIRGTYLLSRSSDVNRIKDGAIQIN